MKIKDYAMIIGVTVVTALIVTLVLSNKKQTTNPAPTQQTQQADSMDDHHKPQPAVSTTFDGLVGNAAQDFTLEDYDGKKVALSSLKGKNAVLFFNEGLMCYPACWNQIVAFGKEKRFNDGKTVTYSIVVDPRKDWGEAIAKMPELAGIPVLFDTNRAVSQNYGVLALNSSMHRGQFPGHSYVIVDKDGIVRFTWDDAQMAVRNQELLTEIEKL